MGIRDELNLEFSRQPHNAEMSDDAVSERYIRIAEGYAETENVLAVLSDLLTYKSYVVDGRFSDIVDVDKTKCSEWVPTIWEDDIFKAVNSEDLEMKMLQELLFFPYISRLPKSRRFNQCLMQRLRMRSRNGEWMETCQTESAQFSRGFKIARNLSIL